MNSQRYEFPSNTEDPSFSDKLCSSQPPMKTCEMDGEPCPRTTVINPQIPAVPPRNYRPTSVLPLMNNAYNSMNQYPYSLRSPYGGYSHGYGGYNPAFQYYSRYNTGTYSGYAMNGYNMSSSDSRFIRAAEESTRPTFQAIESLTRAINSVAFMVESTFGSLNMSFQAVLSVIENFSQARKFLKQFITSIFTLRIFHKFLLMLVHLLRRMNILSEQAISNLPLLNASAEQTRTSVSLWPILTFFGLMFGAPYIISKMLPCEENSQSGTEWNPTTDRFIPLTAVHDFRAETEQELNLIKGQQLKMIPPEIMAPTSPYWVFVADEKNQTGFVPRNHVAPSS